MLFSNSVSVLPGNIQIDNTNISQVESTKFLGVYIGSKLTWKVHIDYLCKLLSRNSGVMNKLKPFVPSHVMFILYSALILPYLNYCVLAWGNSSITLIDRINVVQKRVLRIVNNVGFRAHTNELFYNCNILKISDLHLYNLGIFMYELSQGNLPDVFAPLFQRNYTLHSYPTRQTYHFHLPRTRTAFANNIFTFTGPKFWNSLNKELVNNPSINCFKRKLKYYLLERYMHVLAPSY